MTQIRLANDELQQQCRTCGLARPAAFRNQPGECRFSHMVTHDPPRDTLLITIRDCTIETPRFAVGDRVVRRSDVYDPNSPLRHGQVSRVYAAHDALLGRYPELYAVAWDDGTHDEAFLKHGIDPE